MVVLGEPPAIFIPPPVLQLQLELADLVHELFLLAGGLLAELGVLIGILNADQRPLLLLHQKSLRLVRVRPRCQVHQGVL